ncbi:MAG: hypothetical protein JJ895_09005 [Balneolaceae bacterium]|nr:hypothetical protein [Balneolaceae bacterium]
MLYLISGASRSGKTLLAQKLQAEKNLPYLSLDWLMMGFYNGIPEYGIHPLLMPDEIARKMWPFLKGMIDNLIYDDIDYVIEGEAMLPELLIELKKKYPGKTKAVFLGFADVDPNLKFDQIKTYSTGVDDWLIKESDAYIKDHIENMIRHSTMIREECAKWNLSYFETSIEFLDVLKEAEMTLVGNNE